MRPGKLSIASLALLTAPLLLSRPAAAQTITLHDNLSATVGALDALATTIFISQSFSTGNQSVTLEEVIVPLRRVAASSGTLTVSLLSDNSTNPGSLIGVIGTRLESTITTSLANYSFFPASSLVLDANTRYWIRLSSSTTNGPTTWARANSASGVGVASEYNAYSLDYPDTAFTVSPNTASNPHLMRVNVSPIEVSAPEPASLAFCLFGVIGGQWYVTRRRSNLRAKSVRSSL